MADAEPQQLSQSTLAQTFPNPPTFWRDFTPENISRIEELWKQRLAGNDAGDTSNVRLDDLPSGLTNLQPPPEPEDGRWRVFGDQYTVCLF
jgi:mediator of RNA polymerase II transcription subunit 7